MCDLSLASDPKYHYTLSAQRYLAFSASKYFNTGTFAQAHRLEHLLRCQIRPLFTVEAPPRHHTRHVTSCPEIEPFEATHVGWGDVPCLIPSRILLDEIIIF